MEFTPIIVIHMLAACGALVIGGLTLGLKKGTPLHRVLGRTWVLLMLAAVLASFGIRSSGHFSWIHLLSIATLCGLGAAIYAAINGRIAAHRRGMIYTYVGLIIAGAFTFLPDRRLGHLLWSAAGFI